MNFYADFRSTISAGTRIFPFSCPSLGEALSEQMSRICSAAIAAISSSRCLLKVSFGVVFKPSNRPSTSITLTPIDSKNDEQVLGIFSYEAED